MLYEEIKSTLKTSKQTVYTLILYSSLLGILILAIPASIQTLVNMVGSSLSIRPIMPLIITLLFLLILASFIRILRIYVIENLQRRVFINLFIGMNKHISNISLKEANYNLREKINRAFEIDIIQKNISSIFIGLLDMTIQILVCIIILAFYHPLFLALDIILIIMMIGVILMPFKSAYKSAIGMSNYKYKSIYWLEEQSTNLFFFKQKKAKQYALNKTDKILCDYINERKLHFKALIIQHMGISFIYAFINIALLSLGSYLVVTMQMSLGQLVAAELLVNIVLASFIKFSHYLDDLYILLVSQYKLKDFFELNNDSHENEINKTSINKIKTIKQIDENGKCCFDINFQKNNVININKNDMTNQLIRIFLNLDCNQNTFINNIKYNKLNIFSSIVKNIEIYEGTLLENCLINNYSNDRIVELLNIFDKLNLSFLKTKIDEKINSQTVKYDSKFSPNVAVKITIIRAIMSNPDILILTNCYDSLIEEEKQQIINILNEKSIPTLLIHT